MTDSTSSSAVDLTMLWRLSPEDEAEPGAFVAEVVELFRSHAPSQIEALERAAAAGDLTEAAHVAHGLKGSSGHVGAIRLSMLCARLEADALSGALPETRALVSAISEELDRVLVALTEPGAQGGPP